VQDGISLEDRGLSVEDAPGGIPERQHQPPGMRAHSRLRQERREIQDHGHQPPEGVAQENGLPPHQAETALAELVRPAECDPARPDGTLDIRPNVGALIAQHIAADDVLVARQRIDEAGHASWRHNEAPDPVGAGMEASGEVHELGLREAIRRDQLGPDKRPQPLQEGKTPIDDRRQRVSEGGQLGRHLRPLIGQQTRLIPLTGPPPGE
jgi:hypothetical protein